MFYINGTASLSPQNSLNFENFLKGIVEYNEEFLQSIKPSYKEYMKPIEARRMSKTVKNGIICSQIAMQEAEIDMPDAVIAGTGLGIVTDTERFLENMLGNDEKFLTPTSFIQSTHNTVAAQIALRIKCHAYNFTYVHRGFSFESALFDGIMHINEGKKNILIGGADEMTKHYFNISKKTGWWKQKAINNTNILKSNTSGALCGEGVSFFVLSSEKKEETYASLKGLKMIYKPENNNDINNELHTFLKENNTIKEDIDLIITGNSGDFERDKIYDIFLNDNFSGMPSAYFKHLTGEYQTASAFALWLGANIMKSQKIPEFIMLNEKKPTKIKNILIYNHYFNINHSFMLLSNADADFR
ncbi:MAG: beta-ketoacyl synthase chain length factor [Bacteroidales bacterium]|nr:beta-ketoacyl synthase chain length factor [Bacteroidales bacterium]